MVRRNKFSYQKSVQVFIPISLNTTQQHIALTGPGSSTHNLITVLNATKN